MQIPFPPERGLFSMYLNTKEYLFFTNNCTLIVVNKKYVDLIIIFIILGLYIFFPNKLNPNDFHLQFVLTFDFAY